MSLLWIWRKADMMTDRFPDGLRSRWQLFKAGHLVRICEGVKIERGADA